MTTESGDMKLSATSANSSITSRLRLITNLPMPI